MWYAIYTKPKKEDSVAFRLQNIGIEVLTPKIRSKKFKGNKLTEIIEPLFPCYFFANFDKEKYSHLITYTRGVRYIVGKRSPLIVHDDVINTIRENLEDNSIVIVRPQRFNQGDKILIKDGPFKDFQGIFERESRGSERVMILLETIHFRLELSNYLLAVA